MSFDDKLEINPSEVKKKIIEFLHINLEKRDVQGILIPYRHCIEAIINVHLAIETVGKNNVTLVVTHGRFGNHEPEKITDLNEIKRHLDIPEQNIIFANQEMILKEIREIYSHRYSSKTRHVISDFIPALNYNLSYHLLRDVVKNEMEQRTFTPSSTQPSTQREKFIQKTIAHYKSQIRLRVILAFLFAETENQSVIGCTNKTEFLLGLFTKFGTYYAADYLPLADLYLTQIVQIANYLNLKEFFNPQETPYPSSYDYFFKLSSTEVDRILIRLENGISVAEIAKSTGISQKNVETVFNHYQKAEHARKVPIIPKI